MHPCDNLCPRAEPAQIVIANIEAKRVRGCRDIVGTRSIARFQAAKAVAMAGLPAKSKGRCVFRAHYRETASAKICVSVISKSKKHLTVGRLVGTNRLARLLPVTSKPVNEIENCNPNINARIGRKNIGAATTSSQSANPL
jgi:hypothetical protein